MQKDRIKILFICHGNICRSTMAQSVLTHMVQERGLQNNFEIDSAATSREEIGNPPHYGTKNKLASVGIPLVPHRARQMTKQDYSYYDYLIGMDTANIRNMTRIAGEQILMKRYINCFLLQERSKMWRILGIQGILMRRIEMWWKAVRHF